MFNTQQSYKGETEKPKERLLSTETLSLVRAVVSLLANSFVPHLHYSAYEAFSSLVMELDRL